MKQNLLKNIKFLLKLIKFQKISTLKKALNDALQSFIDKSNEVERLNEQLTSFKNKNQLISDEITKLNSDMKSLNQEIKQNQESFLSERETLNSKNKILSDKNEVII
jgi:peptidoglycan hydrolase CwlO-like protein